MFKSLKTARTNLTPSMQGVNNMESLQKWRLCYNNKCCKPTPEPTPEPQYGGGQYGEYTETFNKRNLHMYDSDDEDYDCKHRCGNINVFISVFIIIASIIFVIVLMLTLWFAYHCKQTVGYKGDYYEGIL